MRGDGVDQAAAEAIAVPIEGPARVLVLLDQPVVGELVRLTLNHSVYEARGALSASEARAMLEAWQPHLAIMDMELGVGLLQEMGGAPGTGTRIPVIGLTRRGDLKTKLAAFDLGVDDIMTVPFSPEELLARALVITRRTYGQHLPVLPLLTLGEIELDILNRKVRVGGHDLHLTGFEQSLLYLLAANAGRLITRDQILDTLWGNEYVPGSNIVDRHVRNLRAKLHDDWRKPRFIATVPGRGYRFLPSGALGPRSA